MSGIAIKKCSDITCFSASHRTCPVSRCCGIMHVYIDGCDDQISFILTRCIDVTCFDKNHVMCPDCYNNIHVKIDISQ